jgi:hypothetical protein
MTTTGAREILSMEQATKHIYVIEGDVLRLRQDVDDLKTKLVGNVKQGAAQ